MRAAHLAPVTLGLGIALIPSVAAGSCAGFPPLEEHLDQAEVVFVGTVTDIADERRTALVAVEEIWRGPDLPSEVTVEGGFPGLGFTSADRYFDAGVRYLFAAGLNEGRIEDNACTATRPWSDDLAALRPASVVTPQPAPAEEAAISDALPVAVVVAGMAAALVVLASVISFRSRAA